MLAALDVTLLTIFVLCSSQLLRPAEEGRFPGVKQRLKAWELRFAVCSTQDCVLGF